MRQVDGAIIGAMKLRLMQFVVDLSACYRIKENVKEGGGWERLSELSNNSETRRPVFSRENTVKLSFLP